MNFKKWVKSIQTVGYNGAHTVFEHVQKHFELADGLGISFELYLHVLIVPKICKQCTG